MNAEPALVTLVSVAGAHLGFQATVSVMIYPAFRHVDENGWEAWHRRHGRRITPLVAATYLALAGSLTWAFAIGLRSGALVIAAIAAGLAVVITGVVAAPLHGRLARAGRRPGTLRVLQLVDLARVVLALVCLVAAAAALE